MSPSIIARTSTTMDSQLLVCIKRCCLYSDTFTIRSRYNSPGKAVQSVPESARAAANSSSSQISSTHWSWERHQCRKTVESFSSTLPIVHRTLCDNLHSDASHCCPYERTAEPACHESGKVRTEAEVERLAKYSAVGYTSVKQTDQT